MRRLIYATLLGVMISASAGCIIPIYSADPARRTRQQIFTSEDMRQILEVWERIWFLEMPDHMTPQRIHGGII